MQVSQASNREMHISLDPSPDYGRIAQAAAAGTGGYFGVVEEGKGLFAGKANTAGQLEKVLAEAVQCVAGRRGAVIEAVLDVGEMGEALR